MTTHLKAVQSGVDVVIIGSNELFREGLRQILTGQDFKVAAAVGDYAAALDSVGATSPDLVIVDADTIDEGISICTLLRGAFEQARIVVMAEPHDLATISRAFTAGVDGYLAKAISCNSLIGALRLIMMGEKIVPSEALAELTSLCCQRPSLDISAAGQDIGLTEREIEILGRLVHGEANKQISRKLQIAEATVKVHIKAVLRKLKVSNRTQAAIWAVNRGLVADPTVRQQYAA